MNRATDLGRDGLMLKDRSRACGILHECWTCRATCRSCAARKGPDIGKRRHSIRSSGLLYTGRLPRCKGCNVLECAVGRHPYNARNLWLRCRPSKPIADREAAGLEVVDSFWSRIVNLSVSCVCMFKPTTRDARQHNRRPILS